MTTKIEWTEDTFNPAAGCIRASPGCDHCYAAEMSLRLEAIALAKQAKGEAVPASLAKYIGVAGRTKQGTAAFNGTINLDWEALNEPLKWRKPKMVFPFSMSDAFHRSIPDTFLNATFKVIAQTPHITYQVLTKRPDRALEYQREYWPEGLPRNVWLMTSTENQQTYDERVPYLVQVKAAVRGLSMEPLLGHVEMGLLGTLPSNISSQYALFADKIHWVIAGGESGRNARPMHPDWARSVRDQCVEADVPFFFKQHGAWWPGEFGRLYPSNHKVVDFADGQQMVNLGKKEAGRLLDGREWSQYPEVHHAN
jgi:protein gp37